MVGILPRICIHSEITRDSKSRDFELSASFDFGLVASYVKRLRIIFSGLVTYQV